MNKKSTRSNLRAPTTQPATTIAPSATLALDGEFPLSASHGVTAPEPLAAHDVLQAAMAPRDETVPDTDASAATTPEADGAATQDVSAQVTDSEEKPGKGAKKHTRDVPQAAVAAEEDSSAAVKPAKLAKPAKAPKALKDKFVKCTFTLPESELAVLDAMKKTGSADGVTVKKSLLLRAALLALAEVDGERLAQLVAQLPAAPRASKKKK